MGQVLSKIDCLFCFKAKRDKPVPAEMQKSPTINKDNDNKPASDKTQHGFIFPSIVNKQFIVSGATDELNTSSNPANHDQAKTTVQGVENGKNVVQASASESDDTTDDDSLDNESENENFDLDDIEDPALATHLHKILTKMARDPTLLPSTADDLAGPDRHKEYREEIVFREDIFGSRCSDSRSEDMSSISPKTKCISESGEGSAQ